MITQGTWGCRSWYVLKTNLIAHLQFKCFLAIQVTEGQTTEEIYTLHLFI